MKKLLALITIALLSFNVQLDAKGGGGSSSSGGGSRSSSSFGSSSKSYSAPSSTPSNSYSSSSSRPSSPSSSASTAKPQTSSRPEAKVERSKYEAASKSGTAFKTRESAVADFKTKNAAKYTSTYLSEPAQRPSHIPTTYSNGGHSYTVIYNQGYGGYGYWNGGGPGIGTFLMYDMMMDNAMLNRQMAQQNYYIGDVPPVYVHHGVFYWFLSIVTGLFIVVIILGIIRAIID